jgi:hypothetical protein
MTARSLIISFSVSALLAFAPNASADRSATPKAVSITASAAPWITVGGRVGITGTVKPHTAGIQVTLQQRHDTGWLSVAAESIRSNGAFSFVTRPDKVGLATYRVVTSKDTNFVGTSARVPVKVLHWVYVTSIESFYYMDPIIGDLSIDPIEANGVQYQHPISLDAGCYNAYAGSAWVDYILERQYEMFTATLALGGEPTTLTVTYSLIGAGKKLASGSIVAGESKKIRVSLHGVYRLRIMVNVPDPTNAGGCSAAFPQVVFGDAQLLGP